VAVALVSDARNKSLEPVDAALKELNKEILSAIDGQSATSKS